MTVLDEAVREGCRIEKEKREKAVEKPKLWSAKGTKKSQQKATVLWQKKEIWALKGNNLVQLKDNFNTR